MTAERERARDVEHHLDALVADLAAAGRRAAAIDAADLTAVDRARLRQVFGAIWDGIAPPLRLRGEIEKLILPW